MSIPALSTPTSSYLPPTTSFPSVVPAKGRDSDGDTDASTSVAAAQPPSNQPTRALDVVA